jgi:hypothetical protein
MAAIIPGLGPIAGDDASGQRGDFNSRPQVSDQGVNIPALHPVATPVDTYYQPPQAVSQAQNLGRIADALSAFQPELAQFSQAKTQLDQVNAKNAVANLNGQNPQDIQKSIATNPDLKGIAAGRMATTYLGNQTAAQTQQEMTQAFYGGGFDRNTGDINQFINGYIQRDMKAHGNDPFFAQGYNDRMDAFKNSLLADQTKFNIQKDQTNKDTLIGTGFDTILQNGAKTNQTPAGVLSAAQDMMHANKAIANMPYGDQQALLLQAIQARADNLKSLPGDQWKQEGALLQGLLTQDRGSIAGQAVGAFTTNPATQIAASRALESVRQTMSNRDIAEQPDQVASLKVLAKNGDKAFPDQLAKFAQDHPLAAGDRIMIQLQSQYDMAQQNQAANSAASERQNYAQTENFKQLQADSDLLDTHNGSQITNGQKIEASATGLKAVPVSAEDRIKNAANFKQSLIDQQPAGPAKDQAEHDLWVMNGLENPKWKSTLNAGFMSASTLTAAGAQIGQATTNGYDQYRKLEAVSPAYTSKMVDGEAGKFYRMAAAGEDSGLDKNVALSQAAKTIHNGTIPTNFGSMKDVDAENAIRNSLPGGISGFLTGSPSLSTATNSQDVVDKIKDDALLLIHGNNMDPAAAIAEASKRIIPQYGMVNGSAVNLATKNTPTNFSDLANGFIQDWWKSNGAQEEKEGHQMSDVTIRQVGNTPNWMMVYKKTGFQPKGDPSFNQFDLGGQQQKIDDAQKAQLQSGYTATQMNNADASRDTSGDNLDSPLTAPARGLIRGVMKGAANSPTSVAPLPGVASDIGSGLSKAWKWLGESHGFGTPNQ